MTYSKSGGNITLELIHRHKKHIQVKQISQSIGNVIMKTIISQVKYSKKGEIVEKRRDCTSQSHD